MFHRLNNAPLQTPAPSPTVREPYLYERDELGDVKKAIEYFYEFKEKLNKLNPIVLDVIDSLFQRRY